MNLKAGRNFLVDSSYTKFKRLISLLLIATNIMLLFSITSFAANPITISVSSASGKVGDTVTVQVSFANLPASGISYYQFDMLYDNSILKVKSYDMNQFKRKQLIDYSTDGKIAFNMASHLTNGFVNDNGIFATITFEIIGNGNSDLDIKNVQIVDSKPIEINDYAESDGKVTSLSNNSPTNTQSSTPTSTSTPTPTSTPTSTPVQTQTINVNSQGLLGEYYDDTNSDHYFTTLLFTRVDPTINFDSKQVKANDIFKYDNFSVRWTGYVEPLYSEDYTFYTSSDDGVRLCIDDVEQIKAWKDQANTEYKKVIPMVAHKKYKILLEYYDNKLDAFVSLSWSSKSQEKQIIPNSQLFCFDSSKPTSTNSIASATPTTTATPTKTTATITPTPKITTATNSVAATPTTIPISSSSNPASSSVTVIQPVTQVPQVPPSDLSIALTADKTSYEVDQNILFTINYRNRLNSPVSSVKLSADIPSNTSIVDSSGGLVSGSKITWDLGALEANKEGTIKYTVKVNAFEGNAIEVSDTAYISSANSTDSSDADNKSALKIMLYPKKTVLGSHKKYIKGYPDNTFKPENKITRAEIAYMIASVLNLDVSDGSLSFTDVKKTHWALKQINAVVKNGFFKGATATKFKPDAYITRAEIAAVIYRCQGIQDSSLDTSDYYFKDTKNNWAGKYIEELYR
ncbi:MAG: PA14 domain-containing protein, partial [Bacillota bacterium]|nr:PA14 domain-containing protein [Bacillota bacterium]